MSLVNLFGAIALDSTLQDVRDAAQSIREAAGGMRAISAARGILADLRVTVINSLTVGTVSTVTTVGTLTNQAQIGGLNATPFMQSMTNNNAAVSNIANVARS